MRQDQNDFYVRCICGDPEHLVVLRPTTDHNDEKCLWVFTQLSPCLSPFKRIWEGIKMILGVRSKELYWAETQVDQEQIRKLHDFLGRLG